MKLAIIPALLLLSAPAVAQTPPIVGETLGVCRKAFIEQLNGKPLDPQAIMAGISEDKRALVGFGCGMYFQGVADLLAVLKTAPSAVSI